MQLLKEFWENKALMHDVVEYMHQQLDEEALKRVYAGETVTGLADARKVLDNAMSNLDNVFGTETQPSPRPTETR